MKALMSLAEAAEETPYSVDYLRAQVHKGDLRAKRGPKNRIVVTEKALRDWINNHQDA